MDPTKREKLYADIAHPINTLYRKELQRAIIDAYHKEYQRSKLPGYKSENPGDFDSGPSFDEDNLTEAELEPVRYRETPPGRHGRPRSIMPFSPRLPGRPGPSQPSSPPDPSQLDEDESDGQNAFGIFR